MVAVQYKYQKQKGQTMDNRISEILNTIGEKDVSEWLWANKEASDKFMKNYSTEEMLELIDKDEMLDHVGDEYIEQWQDDRNEPSTDLASVGMNQGDFL